MRPQRYAKIGESLTLTKDPRKYVFFHSEAEPTADICINLGWTFEFNEPLTYDDSSDLQTRGRRAQLQKEGDFALLVFTDSNECMLLEDVKVHQKLRAKVISYV